MLKTPVIVVNFKTYEACTGKNAVRLARVCERVARETNTEIAVAVQAADLYRVSKAVSIPVLAQHLDAVQYGAFTGHILAECLRENGAVGTLINHSECRIRRREIESVICRARENKLISIACAPDPVTACCVAKAKPDFIAIEPPELIGGELSVSTAEPEIISGTIKKVRQVNRRVPVLCGAGVKDSKDMSIALKLGARGVLLASHVDKAMDPRRVLLDLVKGIKKRG